jgi:hypothetical protein
VVDVVVWSYNRLNIIVEVKNKSSMTHRDIQLGDKGGSTMDKITIMLDHLTLLHLKRQQLEQNKPRPDNYYQQEEKLINEYDNCRDRLIEAMISKNILKVTQSKFIGTKKDQP